MLVYFVIADLPHIDIFHYTMSKSHFSISLMILLEKVSKDSGFKLMEKDTRLPKF